MSEVADSPQSRSAVILEAFHKAARAGIALGLAGAAGTVAMNTVGKTERDIGPLKVTAGANIDPEGDWLTPLDGGMHVGFDEDYVSYPTHWIGPGILVTPKSVSFKRLEEQFIGVGGRGQSKSSSLTQSAREDLEAIEHDRGQIIARSLGSFVLASGGSGLLLFMYNPRRRGKKFSWEPAIGSGLALAAVLGTSGIGYATHNENAFLEPKMHGAVADLYEAAGSVSNARKLAGNTANNAAGLLSLVNLLQERAEERADIPETTLGVMIAADSHDTDFSGYVDTEVQRSEEQGEDLRAILLPGDVADFGNVTATTSTAIGKVSESGLDIFAEPGNHDLNPLMDYIAQFPRAHTVYKGEVATWNIGGWRVLGIGDPNYTPIKGVTTGAASAAEISTLQEKTMSAATAAADAGEPLDAITVHDGALLEGLDMDELYRLGVRGIIVAHKHAFSFTNEPGKPWYIVAGSISGGGLRADQDADGEITPDQYTRLNIDASCQLISLVSVTVKPGGASDSATVEQKFNDEYDPELAATSDRCA